MTDGPEQKAALAKDASEGQLSVPTNANFPAAPSGLRVALANLDVSKLPKPLWMQRQEEAERVKRREEAFQARKLEELRVKKEAELEQTLKAADAVLQAKKSDPTVPTELPSRLPDSECKHAENTAAAPKPLPKKPPQPAKKKEMKIIISGPTLLRAQSSSAGARPKAAARQEGKYIEEQRRRQLEERRREAFYKMQAEVKQRVADKWKPDGNRGEARLAPGLATERSKTRREESRSRSRHVARRVASPSPRNRSEQFVANRDYDERCPV